MMYFRPRPSLVLVCGKVKRITTSLRVLDLEQHEVSHLSIIEQAHKERPRRRTNHHEVA